MAISNGYATLAELKSALQITASSADSELERAIESASRAIDEECGRRFWQDSGVVDDRYYTPDDPDTLLIDDVSTLTGLVVVADDNYDGTYENTWTIDSYTATYSFRAEPRNQASEATVAVVPYTRLRAINGGWPVGVESGVKVSARWGWATVPKAIEQATLLLAERLWKRKDAPFGIIGSTDTGIARLPAVDVDVRRLVAPYRRLDL